MTGGFSLALQATLRDTDALGHVNNAVYVTYLEVGRQAYWWALEGEHYDYSRVPFILASVTIDFRSEALLRLRPSARAPMGLLALGSRVEGRFDSNQGTEFLVFLARSLELCIRTWLELPRE